MPIKRFGTGIIGDIDDLTAPINMSRPDALHWLENLLTEIECRIDAIKEDIRREEKDNV